MSPTSAPVSNRESDQRDSPTNNGRWSGHIKMNLIRLLFQALSHKLRLTTDAIAASLNWCLANLCGIENIGFLSTWDNFTIIPPCFQVTAWTSVRWRLVVLPPDGWRSEGLPYPKNVNVLARQARTVKNQAFILNKLEKVFYENTCSLCNRSLDCEEIAFSSFENVI